MRTNEDLKRIQFRMQGSVQLDLERIEADPVWKSILHRDRLDGDDPDDVETGLISYINHYMAQIVMFENCPSTCGPGDVYRFEANVKKKKITINE